MACLNVFFLIHEHYARLEAWLWLGRGEVSQYLLQGACGFIKLFLNSRELCLERVWCWQGTVGGFLQIFLIFLQEHYARAALGAWVHVWG